MHDLTITGPCGDTGSTTTLDFVFGNYQTQSVRWGPLASPSKCTSTSSWLSVTDVCDGWVQDYTPPEPLPPGSPRWGRGEGCDFVTQSVKGWPSR